jgi:hypothetical protein
MQQMMHHHFLAIGGMSTCMECSPQRGVNPEVCRLTVVTPAVMVGEVGEVTSGPLGGGGGWVGEEVIMQ